MTRQEAFAAGPVALCDHEATEAAEHAKTGDLGAALGVVDWAVEKEIGGAKKNWNEYDLLSKICKQEPCTSDDCYWCSFAREKAAAACAGDEEMEES